jgi:hypothetical protein
VTRRVPRPSRPLLLPLTRGTEIERARQQLQRGGSPRLQMAVIVLFTGVAGLLASHLLRMGGIDTMLLRYPLAVLLAYATFLLLMWAWLRWRGDVVADAMIPDVGGLGGFSMPGAGLDWFGGGGRSGGGGASGTWGQAVGSGSGASEDTVLDLADGDAGVPILAVLAFVALVATAVVAASWVIWSAPVLMAELLVDAAIAGGLYRRMQGMQAQGWWRLCLAHTFWPLLGVLLFFAALGWVAQEIAPHANTLMDVLQTLRGT